MKTQELLTKISGIQTIKSIVITLNITKNKAIYYVYKLRKAGYVNTKYDKDKQRIYYISAENKLGGSSYIEVLNKNSPIKLASSEVYKIYGQNISIEETLVYAIKTKNPRYILASLALFKKISNWHKLYCLAKKNNVLREICALYDLSLKIIRKVKKMPKKFKNNSLPKDNNYKYIIPELKSRDYKEIEKKWLIYIPFNKIDLEEYKK